MTPLRPRAARARSAALGPPVRVLLACDGADLLLPVATAEALGLGSRRGSFKVRLVLPAGSRVVSLSWFERPADGQRFLRATGAQRRLRSDLSLPDGPHEVTLAPELGTATNLHVSHTTASLPAESADAPVSAGMSGGPADVGRAAPCIDTAAIFTMTGAPQQSGRKRHRDGLRAVSDARSPRGADARLHVSTADGGLAPAAGAAGDASPAQQTVRITARQHSSGQGVVVPREEARAAGLRGKYCELEVDVPKLRRKVTLSLGWGHDRFRIGKGWRQLADDMRLPVDASVVLTVADGTICSVERASAPPAAGNSTSTPVASSGAMGTTSAVPSPPIASAPQGHESARDGVGEMTAAAGGRSF